MKNQNGFSSIYEVVVIVVFTSVIFIAGMYAWQYYVLDSLNKKVQADNIVPIVQQVDSIESNFSLQGMAIDTTEPNRLMTWLRPDNKLYTFKGSLVLEYSFDTIEETKSALQQITNYFQENSYEINEINNLPDGIDLFLDPQIGFEKGLDKCVVYWFAGNSFERVDNVSLKVLCGVLTEQDKEYFDTFYPVVATSDDARVAVSKVQGDYAVGTINFYRTGAVWYASKKEGIWTVDEITQELPCYKHIINVYPRDFFTEEAIVYCEKYPY